MAWRGQRNERQKKTESRVGIKVRSALNKAARYEVAMGEKSDEQSWNQAEALLCCDEHNGDVASSEMRCRLQL